MIGWEDVYKVVTAMVPLYVALALGYSSVKWWKWNRFEPDQCDAINRFNCYFILPFFNFHFISHVNPYKMNYSFLSADVVAKSIIGIILVFWANCSRKGSLSWSITTFSLSGLNNTLIIGVPYLKAMYGDLGVDILVQSSLIQSLLWFIPIWFMFELRSAISDALAKRGQSGENHEVEIGGEMMEENTTNQVLAVVIKQPSIWLIMKIVWVKLVKNPNFYAWVIGLIWALFANRWHFQMPEIVEGSILIMSKAGVGVAMFSMGLFMALQEKLNACGASLTLYGLVLRFVVGPATMAIGSVASGLRSNVFRVAVIQAALPQSITSFVYAKEYGLHAEVLSTAVMLGTLASLPMQIAYYAIIDLIH